MLLGRYDLQVQPLQPVQPVLYGLLGGVLSLVTQLRPSPAGVEEPGTPWAGAVGQSGAGLNAGAGDDLLDAVDELPEGMAPAAANVKDAVLRGGGPSSPSTTLWATSREYVMS